MNYIETHLAILIVGIIISWAVAVMALLSGAVMLKRHHPIFGLLTVASAYGFIALAFVFKVCVVLSIVLKVITHAKG